MSNIEKACYKKVREQLIGVNEDIRVKIDEMPYACECLEKDIEKINHIIDMLDIVYGATKDGDLDGE